MVGVGEKEAITSYLLHVSLVVVVESLSIEFLRQAIDIDRSLVNLDTWWN